MSNPEYQPPDAGVWIDNSSRSFGEPAAEINTTILNLWLAGHGGPYIQLSIDKWLAR